MSQPPRVFISYSHDNEVHRAFVLDLANRLTEDGLDCEIDQYIGWSPEEGWTTWMQKQLRQADFVLMVCTERYRQCFEHEIDEGGRGATFEGRLITQKLYKDYGRNRRFIPVLPPQGSQGHIPEYLQDVTAFQLMDQYDDLYWVLTRQVGVTKPERGEIRKRGESDLETCVDAYLDWLQQTSFLKGMDAYTEMDGIKRLRAEPDVCVVTFIGEEEDEFADLDELCGGMLERKVLEEKRFDNILEALDGFNQGIFLGKPGAGKSTTLGKLAHDTIRQHGQRDQRIVPVVLRLGFWVKPEQSLLAFIHEQTNPDQRIVLGDAFVALLEQNRILLILDGLNEMPVGQQTDKGRQIRELFAANPQLQAYASCREDDYSDALRLPLPEFHIQPLSIPKIKTFILGYLQANGVRQPEKAAEKLFWDIAGGQELQAAWQAWEKTGATHEQFWAGKELPDSIYSWEQPAVAWQAKVRDNPQNLIRLARNPFLLAMLMRVGKPGQAFPQNRGALLARFYQLLVKREADQKHKPKNNADLLQDGGKQLEALIGKLAWAMAEQTQTSSPRYETLTIMGHDEQWLKLAIRCNVLEQIGGNIRFSHQLLQDYFIAIGMKQRLDARELPVEYFWQQYGKWWEPTGWEEPVILLAGRYQDCTPVVEWLAQANPRLAARCIRESGVPCADVTKANLREPWQERLTNLDTDPHPYARAAIGTALAWVDLHGRPLDQRKGVGLDANGLPDIDWVECDGYKMGRYPVTNMQFQAFIADGGYETDEWWKGLQKPDSLPNHRWTEGNRPVERVNWYDAMAFCRWFSSKMDLDVRLPTEQQWEKAARYPDDREYPWVGGYKSGYANIDETGNKGAGDFYLQETSAVGIYPQGKSHLGLMDMAGNVWEWCLNKWDDPQIITADLSNSGRVVRGGSWDGFAGSCRSAFRNLRRPHYRVSNLGFRVVLCLRPH